MDGELVHEIPESLKRLARMVVRGFYSVEHVIVIDMLIRNPCMKEDDLVDLLKFDRKQLRMVISQLKNDKFIKVKLKMETGPDGRATRQNYYYINYKVFVNVVKYKLDHMLRKLETEERDSTSRASFKCLSCEKTFTDLEADQLYDMSTGEFRCTFCNTVVEEEQSALPKENTRAMIAKFNTQIKPLYDILQEVEDIKLAPELLEPEPTDLSALKRESDKSRPAGSRPLGERSQWSGDATRTMDYGMGHDVSVTFGEDTASVKQVKKDAPIWLVESTVAPELKEESIPFPSVLSIPEDSASSSVNSLRPDDIMEVLLAHEKKSMNSAPIIPGVHQNDDSNESEPHREKLTKHAFEDIEELEDESDEDVPMVTIGDQCVPLLEVTEELISKMTAAEKEYYIKLSQEVYSTMYE